MRGPRAANAGKMGGRHLGVVFAAEEEAVVGNPHSAVPLALFLDRGADEELVGHLLSILYNQLLSTEEELQLLLHRGILHGYRFDLIRAESRERFAAVPTEKC